jgi:tetratricopeptide (TPR) repeat protein
VAEEQGKNRWVKNAVLVFAVVGLLGGTIYPLTMMMNSGTPTANAPASPSASPSGAPSSSPSPGASTPATDPRADLKKQAEAYELLLQREPDNQTALRGLLEARLGMADVKGAIAPLEKLVQINPQDTKLAVLLAQAKQQANDPEAAATVYRSVLQKQPGELNALGGLAALLLEQKRPEAAVNLLKDTIKEAPNSNKAAPGSVDVAAVQILLGKVHASEKKYSDAIASFDAAAKDNPQNFQPIYYKAALLKEQGKLDEAKPLFEKAAALAPAEAKDQIRREASGDKAEAPKDGAAAQPDAAAKSEAAADGLPKADAPLASPSPSPAKP